MAADPTLGELFAVLLARDFREEDRSLQVGANLPMARAAAVMASITNRPDLRVILGMGVNNLSGGRPAPPVYPFLFDPRSMVGEAVMVQERVFDDVARPDVFFVGGLQLDRRGNLNLFGIPDGEGGWKLRGPGGVALATMSTNCSGYYIVMPRHDARTFVDEVALITALGDRTERERLGLPGGGPRFVLSPLGVFDFDDAGEMQIRSLHEGVTLAQVQEATGFPLDHDGDPPVTEPPSDDELTLLRERVDVERTLA
jgi:glutaconate CoA-transferase, subunit B